MSISSVCGNISYYFLVCVPDTSFPTEIQGLNHYSSVRIDNHSSASHISSSCQTLVCIPSLNSPHPNDKSDFIENVSKQKVSFTPKVVKVPDYGFTSANLTSVSSTCSPCFEKELNAAWCEKMGMPLLVSMGGTMPSYWPHSQGGKEMPKSNPGEHVTPNSLVGKYGPPFGTMRPQHNNLKGMGGATKLCPMTYLPKQQAQMHQPVGDGASVMYPPVIPVGLRQRRMLQSPQQAIHKLKNQNFSAPGTNTVTISEQCTQTGGLKGSFHPPLQKFWDGGQGGRCEIIEELGFKPQSINNGNSRYSVHNCNTGMAIATTTTTMTTTTGSGRIVNVDHVIKDHVPPIRASNGSGVSGMKNYTMVCHPPERHGETLIAGAGAGGCLKTSGRCHGSRHVRGAVVGNSEVVAITSSFRNFSSGTPRQAMEGLGTISPGEFIFIILFYYYFFNLYLCAYHSLHSFCKHVYVYNVCSLQVLSY